MPKASPSTSAKFVRSLPSPSDIQSARTAAARCATWEDARSVIAKVLNRHPDTITRLRKRLTDKGALDLWVKPESITDGDGDSNSIPSITTSQYDDTMSVDVAKSKAATLDEVIQLCKIDTAQWESKGFTVRPTKDGHTWSARFAKKKEYVDIDALARQFAAKAVQHAPKKWNIVPRQSTKPECIYVLNIHDQHLGKLAHGTETGGANWDIKIAERVYRETVDELIQIAPTSEIEEVVVIVGSDMLQVDSDRSTTTAGTYVDSDTRLSKAFDVAANMLSDVVEQLASKFRVRIIVVPGNHDSVTSYFLGRYVEAWFRNHPNVVTDASPRTRKYLGYGKVLLAFDHGDAVKPKDMPLVIMRENQSTISQYKYTEVLVGHLHRESCEDHKGIVMRVAPALCSPDRWHSSHGFVGSMRRSQGLLYHREFGLRAIYYSKSLD